MQEQTVHTPLRIENLSHRFGKVVALDDISLQLKRQGITALLGSNGAGKTTLINCALGLLRPSAGQIQIFGQKAGTLTAKHLTGLMLQDANLPDLLTAREHISLFSTYYPDPRSVESVIDRCGLHDFANKKYKGLSGGQKRRVQFALAILGRPKLIFLDEPTTGLDTEARKVLWNTIYELRDSGTSVVLTTHYMEEADALADHVVVIGHGKIIASGTNSDIRDAVSGSIIRCTTDLDSKSIEQLKSVRACKTSGRYQEILCSNGSETLRELFNSGAQVNDITVQQPSLEDAFEQISDNDRGLL